MYEVLLWMFAIGILTRLVDMAVDDGVKFPGYLAYTAGVAYGILIAYVVASYPLISPLCLGVVIAVMFTGKIDKKPHIAGIGAMVLFLGLWGLPGVDIFLLAIFLVAGIMDEMGSDLADKGRVSGMSAKVLQKRVVLEIVTFIVSFITGYWIIFLGMLSFDTGYLLTEKTGKVL